MKTKFSMLFGISLLFFGVVSQVIAQAPITDEENGVTTILLPGGAAYFESNATITGGIKITLPVLYTNTMLKVHVDIFDYANNQSMNVIASGYNYVVTSKWVNCTGQVFTTTKEQDLDVHFGDDGTNTIIWIGEPTSTWKYLGVRVTKVQASFSGHAIDAWDDGWTIGVDPSNFKITPKLVTVDATLPFDYWQANGDDISYQEGGVGIGMDGKSTATLSVLKETTNGQNTKRALDVFRTTETTTNVTSYDKALYSGIREFNIPQDKTDSGYKIALDASAFAYNPLFAGTLNANYGLWARSGIYSSGDLARVNKSFGVNAEILARDGIIDKAYGVYISSSLKSPGVINEHFDLYAASSSAKNYFAGNLGIGTTIPNEKLTVAGNINNTIGSGGTLTLFESNATRKNRTILGADEEGAFLQATWATGGTDAISFRNTTGDQVMLITKDANVNIGTTDLYADYKLSVAGKVRAIEVKVQPESEWADYVFEADYELRSLTAVKKYIDEKGHLPDIPSAEEVAANGFSLGEMDANLLRKIEELTLYMLKKEEEVKTLLKMNEDLQSRLERIEKYMEQ